MVSILNNIILTGTSIPASTVEGTKNIVKTVSDLSEKKDEYIAVTIANRGKSDERANATTIGAVGSAALWALKTGMYFRRKGASYGNSIIDWYMNSVKWYMDFVKKFKIGKIPVLGKGLGMAISLGCSVVSGGLLGYAIDLYSTAKNTIINGKISDIKSGVNGSWIQSSLKSMSRTLQGKEIIRNSIQKNDDGSVTVKFKGVNKEYNLTKKELKDASHSYITYKNEDKTKVTGFKKKFSKGDGDVLAFELAFEKYCKDVRARVIPEDENIPKSLFEFSDTGDLITTNGEPRQFYYLLTGKHAEKLSSMNENNDGIDQIYSKKGILNFVDKFKDNSYNYASEIRLHSDKNKNINIRDKYKIRHTIKNDNRYAIDGFDGKNITLADVDNTKEKLIVPIKNIEKYIREVNYVDLSDNS